MTLLLEPVGDAKLVLDRPQETRFLGRRCREGQRGCAFLQSHIPFPPLYKIAIT